MVPLTATEFEILAVLAATPGKPVTNEILLERVWPGIHVGDATLRKHIQGLRRKLHQASGGADLVRNFPNRGYLLASEIAEQPRIETPLEAVQTEPSAPGPDARQRKIRRLFPWSGAALLACCAIWVLTSSFFRISRTAQPTVNPPGRVFVHATSEGSRMKHIPLSHPGSYIALSTDSRKLFATSNSGRTLSVVDTVDGGVKEYRLPIEGGPLQALADGRLFIASSVDGLMVWDIRKERLAGGVIRTGGLVHNIVAAPDGEQLFLTMGSAGLKRISTRTLAVTPFNDRLCPMFVATGGTGKDIYVSYQCSGPTGKPGQDPVEVLDSATGKMVWKTNEGLPMVGGPITLSPDGHLVLFDGQDACKSTDYRRDLCPEFPSRIFHLFSAVDHRLFKTFTFAPETDSANFIDDARFLLTGSALEVIDARKYSVLERMDVAPAYYRTRAFDPETRQLYLSNVHANELLNFQAESGTCAEPEPGLDILFSGDGTFRDVIGLAAAEPRGEIRFRPGKVGQAFSFERDGSTLVVPWLPYFEFSTQDATVAFYVKFASVDGERVLVYHMLRKEEAGMSLQKSATGRLIATIALVNGSSVQVDSQTVVRTGVWYHVVLTRTDDQAALYVNGIQEHAVSLKGVHAAPVYRETPLYLGSNEEGRLSLSGMLDEVAFYKRALSPDEVSALFQKRETGPCRP